LVRELFYFSANPLQELGGSFYPFNFKLDFGYLLINTTKNFAFAYLFHLIIYSISIIVLLKTLTSLNNFTFLTALILPILTFWDLKYRFYPITAMVPSWSIFLSIFNFTCAAIFARHISYLLKSLIIWFMFIYVLFLSPTTLLFMVPLVFLICLLDFLMTKKIENVLIIFVITILIFVTGISSYLKGIYENSYTSGFQSELFSDRGDRLGFSTIFWISPNNFILGSLICLIFTSCIIGLRDKNISLRIFCIFILIYYLFTGFLAYFFYFNKSTSLPDPVYFESFIWSILFISVSSSVSKIKLFRKVQKLPSFASSALFVVFLSLLLSLIKHDKQNQFRYLDTSISVANVNQDELIPNSPFQGRSIRLNNSGKFSQNWFDLFSADMRDIENFGQEFRAMSLWNSNLPTLFGYSPLISKQFYYFNKLFLVNPIDQQIRNVIVNQKINIPVYRILGITKVYSDYKIDFLPLLAEIKSGHSKVFIYQVKDSNLKGYGPLKIEKINSFKELVEQINSSALNINTAYSFSSDHQTLAAIARSKIIPIKGGYRFLASAEVGGTSKKSVLVTPIEFSNCWIIENNRSNSETKLLKINGLFLALMFNKKLDTTIKFKHGPFSNQTCRLEDSYEFDSTMK